MEKKEIKNKWAVAKKGSPYILTMCKTEEEADAYIGDKTYLLEKRRIIG